MAKINLSVSQFYEEFYGYKSDAFKFDKVKGDNKFSRVDVGKVSSSPYYSSEGTLNREYYLPIGVQVGTDLMPGTQTTYAEAFGLKDQSGAYTGRWELPYPVMRISSNKKIIDTELTERNGPVSELINMQGWKIAVKGLLISKTNDFPEDEYTRLVRLYELNIPIRINNPLTDVLFVRPDRRGTQEVTMRNLEVFGKDGVKHVWGYTCDLVSNEDFNLIDIS